MNDLVKEYRNAAKNIKISSDQMDTIKKEANKKTSNIEWEGREAARKIENEYRLKADAIKEEAKKKIEQLIKENAGYHETRVKVQRYFKLLELRESGGFKVEPEVYVYSHKDPQGKYISNARKVFYEHVGILRQDKYNDIRLYIVENGNSVNNLSIIIRGSSFFGDDLRDRVKISQGYINNCHDNCNIQINLKIGSSKEELLKYIERSQNFNKMKEMLPANLDALAKEYEIVCELIKDKEWQILYLEHKKDYYENRYSHGTETDEYKEILKKLKKLKSE